MSVLIVGENIKWSAKIRSNCFFLTNSKFPYPETPEYLNSQFRGAKIDLRKCRGLIWNCLPKKGEKTQKPPGGNRRNFLLAKSKMYIVQGLFDILTEFTLPI